MIEMRDSQAEGQKPKEKKMLLKGMGSKLTMDTIEKQLSLVTNGCLLNDPDPTVINIHQETPNRKTFCARSTPTCELARQFVVGVNGEVSRND